MTIARISWSAPHHLGRSAVLTEVGAALDASGLGEVMSPYMNQAAEVDRLGLMIIPVSVFAAALPPDLAAALESDELIVDLFEDANGYGIDGEPVYLFDWFMRFRRNPELSSQLPGLITGWWLAAGVLEEAPSEAALALDPERNEPLRYAERNGVRMWIGPLRAPRMMLGGV
jgi:hypothetical protein